MLRELTRGERCTAARSRQRAICGPQRHRVHHTIHSGSSFHRERTLQPSPAPQNQRAPHPTPPARSLTASLSASSPATTGTRRGARRNFLMLQSVKKKLVRRRSAPPHAQDQSHTHPEPPFPPARRAATRPSRPPAARRRPRRGSPRRSPRRRRAPPRRARRRARRALQSPTRARRALSRPSRRSRTSRRASGRRSSSRSSSCARCRWTSPSTRAACATRS